MEMRYICVPQTIQKRAAQYFNTPDSLQSMFSMIDWAVLAAYMAAVLLIGVWAGRRKEEGDDFFLAGRSMPSWAVAVSVLATALSAATFIGGPQQSYRGDLTYLASNAGGLIAVLIVGFIFLPAFYAAGTPSIYGYLGQRFSVGTQAAAGGMFMLGRLLASGARLFITAIPFSLIAFGSAEGWPLVIAILLVTVAAAAYTMLGGIRAVIWTDVLQAVVVVGTVTIAVFVLLSRIDLPISEIVDRLQVADGGDKLQVVDWSLDPAKPYTAWASLIGFTIFMVAAFGTDQDLTQRMLTCRTPRKATWAVILSNLLGWPVVLLFLVVGLLLWTEEQVHGPILPGLPDDSDRSARRIRDNLKHKHGIDAAIIISDTFGRPWRRGLTDVSIGSAGVAPILDLRGTPDALGREMQVTEVALVDELAGAAELVMGKTFGVPVAIIRGGDPSWFRDGSTVEEIVRDPSEDLFR